MAINTSALNSTLQTKVDALVAATDTKEVLLLSKALDAAAGSIAVSDVLGEGVVQVNNVSTEGTTQISNVQAAGATQVAAVQAAGSGYLTTSAAASTYSPLANPTFTGTVNAAALTLSGDLTVNGTQTTINSTNLTVDDLNITVASGAADAAAASGAGLTVDGASANITYTASTDTWDFNKAITGTYTNFHPTVNTANVTISQAIDMTKPMHHFDMTGATAFSGVSISAGRTSMMLLDTTVTPHAPSWGSYIKWPGAIEPTWADSRYWIVSMTCVDGLTILASAQGYTV